MTSKADKSDKGEVTAAFASNLKRILQDMEMTYRDLSELSGQSLRSIYMLSKGEQSPSLSTVERIAKVMRSSPHALITPDASLDLMMSRRSERAQRALNAMSAEKQREAIKYLENLAEK